MPPKKCLCTFTLFIFFIYALFSSNCMFFPPSRTHKSKIWQISFHCPHRRSLLALVVSDKLTAGDLCLFMQLHWCKCTAGRMVLLTENYHSDLSRTLSEWDSLPMLSNWKMSKEVSMHFLPGAHQRALEADPRRQVSGPVWPCSKTGACEVEKLWGKNILLLMVSKLPNNTNNSPSLSHVPPRLSQTQWDGRSRRAEKYLTIASNNFRKLLIPEAGPIATVSDQAASAYSFQRRPIFWQNTRK